MLNLFQPGRIGSLRIKNRIVMASMGSRGLVELDGRISHRMIDYFVARAAGGSGLLITGITYVDVEIEPHLEGAFSPGSPRADSPLFLARFEELANAVHAYGAKIAVQLTAGRGRIASADDQNAGRVIAPSPVPCFWPPHKKARELTVEEIEILVRDFGIAAKMLRDAGIDAIELHGHEGYLLDEFTTALWNKRIDKYGGDLESRLRFPLEIIESVKSEAGTDFPIIYKFGSNHHLDGARSIDESCEMAKCLQQAGVSTLEVDAGCYETAYYAHPPIYMPPGCLLDGIEAVKKVVDIPVIAVGKLGYPKLAEEVLRKGQADFIALGRQLLADPEWPLKVKEERLDDIRMCIGCHECFRRLMQGKYLSCAVNPATGIEKELALNLAKKKKRILVVGGGPGGMEAARVAALRRHDVTLWEKEEKLGGNLISAAVPNFKNELSALTEYLVNQVKKLGVNVELMKEATPKLIEEMNPDEIIVATGATPKVLDCPGVSNDNVITSVDALLGNKKAGDKVVVIGGGELGCEVAVWLAHQGKEATVVEVLQNILPDTIFMNKMMLQKMLAETGVTILTGASICEIKSNEVIIQTDNKQQTLGADTVVLAVGLECRETLVDSLKGKLSNVHVIGDCAEPREIKSAIWEAYNTARVI